MPSEECFQPNWASPPGDTIAELMRLKGLALEQLARRLECSVSAAKDLIAGLASIDDGRAKQLESLLGPSAKFWSTRELQYRKSLARIGAEPDVASQQEWIRLFPMADMISFGWIQRRSSLSDKLDECLKFFGVSTVRDWYQAYGSLLRAAAFRTSASFKSNPAAVIAWLRWAELRSKDIECAPWNPKRFAAALREVRSLTRLKSPKDFLPRLIEICAACGVAVVVARAPEGCRASGATRFVSEKKALIVLSFRHLSDDHFWFTFFHEAGHLLRHNKSALFIEDGSEVTAAEEKEANEFASRVLIPDQEALLNVRLGYKDIIKFAWEIGIAPGIVVGQLQHLGRLDRSRLNRLKRRYTWAASGFDGD